MSLDTFVRILPKLSKEISSQEFSMVKSLDCMISEYFEPLYNHIMKKVFFETGRDHTNRKIEPQERQRLKSVELERLTAGIRRFEESVPDFLFARKRSGAEEFSDL